MKWKPISTAPKDGTIVWVLGPLVSHKCLARWNGSAWIMVVAGRDDHGVTYDNPSHWAQNQ